MSDQNIALVAELGINHGGDLGTAVALIHAAKKAGADYVKFQKRTLNIVYTEAELAAPRSSPYGTTNGDLKRKLEFSKEQYDEINHYCEAAGIRWTASPWDVESVDFLMNYDLPFIKVASASVTDKFLLRELCKTKKPLHISTGMCDMALIKEIVSYINAEEGNLQAIYHCTSTYPARPDELNLNGIHTLINEYGAYYTIGYSGHEPTVTPSVIAAAMGAQVIERHLTLNKKDYGSDQAASLEPDEFAAMSNAIRLLPVMLGDGDIKLYEREVPIAAKLRRANDFV